MSNHGPITRTAPIAIAPKPKRSSSTRQSSINHFDGGSGTRSPGSMNDSADSDSAVNGPGGGPYGGTYGNGWPAVCDGCRRRRVKCLLAPDEEDVCISCQVNGEECSLVGSPQPRKRKQNGEFADEGAGKRR